MSRKTLPNDTRLVELISAMTLLCSGVASMLWNSDFFSASMIAIQPREYWATTAIVFGLLQLMCTYMDKKAEMVRGVLSWTTGAFWVWAAMESISESHFGIPEICIFFMGITNLYAFVINTAITLRKSEG